ncbi:mannose-1-phosphate guanyltransferase [bacterium]|nr:mannose-1-phosphate guanyltransferase [bacterium]
MNYAIILAGGRGERFWPLSTRNKPKQLLSIFSESSMLEETIKRVEMLIPRDKIKIVTNMEIKEQIQNIIPVLNEKNFLIEPCNRNTAAAIGLAAIKLIQEDPQAIMCVLPSDHIIEPRDKFVEALKCATETVANEKILVLFGVEPTRPETNYGYIEVGEECLNEYNISCRKVVQFKEKPSRVLAQEFYLDHKHLWNSGMFIWKASDILEAIKTYLPELHYSLNEYQKFIGTELESARLDQTYQDLEDISIDYGILEKAQNVRACWANFKWDDVGSWLAIDRVMDQDNNSNTIIGNTTLINTYNSTIINNTEDLIFVDGVSDLLIVKTDSSLLLLHKSRIDDMRKIVDILKNKEELKKYL